MNEQQLINSLARTRMATEIRLRRAPKQRQIAMAALRLAAIDIGATLHGSEGAERFRAACGL